MTEYVFGNVRIQFLSSEIVRIEYAKKGKFFNGNTFFISDKSAFNEEVKCKKYGGYIVFGDYSIAVNECARGLSGVSVIKDGRAVYKYKKLANSGELPALDKTPEVFAVSDSPRITIPEGGYSYHGKKKNSGYKIEENVYDVYLLICGGDAKKLRRLYVSLIGRSEMVRLPVLGSWNSKYFAYSEESAKQLILDYEKHNIPLDCMVIDTDWRAASDRGIGYDVDENLFPDMKRFLRFAHSKNVEIMFNDHPEPVEGADSVLFPAEVKYREEKLQSLLKMGLDIWWYDRNWITKLKSPTSGINPETWGMYLFEDITRHYFQKLAKNKEIYRRPVIMGNVDDIQNGLYTGINNSASHRYSVQWTGDITSDDGSIAQEVENLIKSGNNALPYVNADCGGHTGNPEKELFIRWMQFGTLSPVFRPHCTKDVKRYREPWLYDTETEDVVREYINLRYRLLPIIYKNAYASYESGEPIFKALGWEYPADKKALKRFDEYMLGNDILVAPYMGAPVLRVEKGCYISPVKATYYNGTELKGEPIHQAEYEELFFMLNHTKIHKEVPVYNFSARFKTELRFDKDVELYINTDDGATVWINGKKVLEDKTLHSATKFYLETLSAGQSYKVEIEYFQAGGEAACMLCYKDKPTSEDRQVYLPAGKWLDVFGGKIYAGGKTVAMNCNLKSMPLFIRFGALLPLAYAANNVKSQKWDSLIYEYYPDKNSLDEGYLYEDDTETTAYKLGQFRKSAYKAYYSEGENAYDIKLFAAEGAFYGERAFSKRNITIKYHMLARADRVKRVTLNGKEVPFGVYKKDKSAFPLNNSEAACDSDTVCITLATEIYKDYEIKIYLL